MVAKVRQECMSGVVLERVKILKVDILEVDVPEVDILRPNFASGYCR